MGKKRNRKHSKIDKLPADLREAVDMMLQGDFTYEDVANFIRDNAGITISTTSVWRYATGLNATVESLRIVEQNFRTLMDEMERYPNLDTTEAIARLLSHKVLTAIQNVDESMWSEIDPAELMKQSTNLMRAISYKNDMDVKVKNLKDVAYDSMKEEIYSAMAKENPELYRALVEYLNQQKENE